MKLSDVLIKPILSEKANKQGEKMNRYAFVVDKKANKLEIKKAVEMFYGVQVEEVNTMVMPSKLKEKYTKKQEWWSTPQRFDNKRNLKWHLESTNP